MYILNKSIRLHEVVMMIKDYKHLIKLQRIHTEQTHSKYAKYSFEETVNISN